MLAERIGVGSPNSIPLSRRTEARCTPFGRTGLGYFTRRDC
jgi:hypothetical protein